MEKVTIHIPVLRGFRGYRKERIRKQFDDHLEFQYFDDSLIFPWAIVKWQEKDDFFSCQEGEIILELSEGDFRYLSEDAQKHIRKVAAQKLGCTGAATMLLTSEVLSALSQKGE